MAKGNPFKENHPLILSLLILLSYQWTALQADAASLCCGFNVGISVSRQWRNEVQGQVNTAPSLLHSDNKCHATDAHGNRLSATEICSKQFDSLNDQVYRFQEVLDQIHEENKTIRGTEPLSLQCIMCGWSAGDEYFRVSWDISLNGSNMFHGDTKERLQVYSGFNWTEEMLEKIRNLNDLLNRTSQGEFVSILRKTKLLCEDNLQPTALPTSTADVHRPPSTACMPNPSVLMVISCFLLYIF